MPRRSEGPRRGKLVFATDHGERSLFRQRDGRLFIGRDFGPLGVDLREGLPPNGGGCTKRGSKKRSANGISHRRLPSNESERAFVNSSRGRAESYHKDIVRGIHARKTERPA